jgi:hypothetical protein
MKRRDFLTGLLAAAGTVGWQRPRVAARIRFGYAAITWNGNDAPAIEIDRIQRRKQCFEIDSPSTQLDEAISCEILDVQEE